ncbi:MAG TPA: hypothetical protein VMZ31_06945 [Phycisphaerae bacterium]|nr:hypothetical protein [Phycisphaerae bacterium]
MNVESGDPGDGLGVQFFGTEGGLALTRYGSVKGLLAIGDGERNGVREDEMDEAPQSQTAQYALMLDGPQHRTDPGRARPLPVVLSVLGLLACLSAGQVPAAPPSLPATARGDVGLDVGLSEPTTWVGKSFPLLRHMDIQESISTGRWVVLLYHHDCPDCQRIIPDYTEMSDELSALSTTINVAMVQIPPYGASANLSSGAYITGRLDDTRTWGITSPVVVLMNRARVEKAWSGKAPARRVLLEAAFMLEAGPVQPKALNGPGARDGSSVESLIARSRSAAGAILRVRLPTQSPPWVCFCGFLASGGGAIIEDAGLPALDARQYLLRNSSSDPSARNAGFRLRRGKPFPARAQDQRLWFEEHRDSFLWALAESNVPLDQAMRVGGRSYKLSDLLENSMLDVCEGRRRLEWTASAFARYLLPSQRWTNKYGEPFSYIKVVRLLVNQEQTHTPATKTQFLMALALATDRPELEDDPGVARRSQAILEEHIATAKRTQTQSGGWAEDWVKPTESYLTGPMARLGQTGRMLQWLSVALPSEHMRDGWVLNAVEYLCARLEEQPIVEFVEPEQWADEENRYVWGVLADALYGLRLWRRAVGDLQCFEQ